MACRSLSPHFPHMYSFQANKIGTLARKSAIVGYPNCWIWSWKREIKLEIKLAQLMHYLSPINQVSFSDLPDKWFWTENVLEPTQLNL